MDSTCFSGDLWISEGFRGFSGGFKVCFMKFQGHLEELRGGVLWEITKRDASVFSGL